MNKMKPYHHPQNLEGLEEEGGGELEPLQSFSLPQSPLLTHVMLYQLLHGLELGPCGDIIAAAVQLPDLIMLYVVSFYLIPVPDGQRIGT